MIKDSRTLIFLIILISFLFLASIAEAVDIKTFFQNAAATIRGWAAIVAGVAFGFCAILIATSGGNPRRLAEVKEALVYIAVGFAVVEFSATFIIPAGVSIAEGLGEIAKGLGMMAAVAGVIYLGYGIFEFATSGGDPSKLDEAKTAIMWAVIGVIIGAAGATGGFSTIITATGAKSATEQILNILGAIAAIIGVGTLAFGLFRFATSGGDPRTLAEAKTLLMWGGIGIILGVFFREGIDTILTFFGISW